MRQCSAIDCICFKQSLPASPLRAQAVVAEPLAADKQEAASNAAEQYREGLSAQSRDRQKLSLRYPRGAWEAAKEQEYEYNRITKILKKEAAALENAAEGFLQDAADRKASARRYHRALEYMAKTDSGGALLVQVETKATPTLKHK
ncbi:hypothetical protein N9L68_00530 [bacterium]|nr:hypothetical protein [bacterium]